MVATLCCGWGRCANGSAKATLGTAKWWRHGYTTPPCLHWYTTVVTRRRRNSSKWWHIILLRTSFLGHGTTFSNNPSLLFFFTGTRSPSSNLEDHVWFEDWWMVASLCDEWLTTLCGLILG
jgi:hypothetical protein